MSSVDLVCRILSACATLASSATRSSRTSDRCTKLLMSLDATNSLSPGSLSLITSWGVESDHAIETETDMNTGCTEVLLIIVRRSVTYLQTTAERLTGGCCTMLPDESNADLPG